MQIPKLRGTYTCKFYFLIVLSLGLTIQGGVDTPTPGIIIREVREGGAAHNDGFLKVRHNIRNPCSYILYEHMYKLMGLAIL